MKELRAEAGFAGWGVALAPQTRHGGVAGGETGFAAGGLGFAACKRTKVFFFFDKKRMKGLWGCWEKFLNGHGTNKLAFDQIQSKSYTSYAYLNKKNNNQYPINYNKGRESFWLK